MEFKEIFEVTIKRKPIWEIQILGYTFAIFNKSTKWKKTN